MDEPRSPTATVLVLPRAGFAGSDGIEGPISIAEHAAHIAGS